MVFLTFRLPQQLRPLAMMVVVALFSAVLITPSAQAADKLPRLVLAGPFASVSNPLIRMAQSGALNDVAEQVEFQVWSNPDQMRAMSLRGDVDFIATPTNVAANLYNRGADIRLLNVSVWGLLWMVSREPALTTIADFKGREIAMPFRGDMPHLVFSELARTAGLDPKKDFKLRFVASPLDAMQLLIMRRVDHALLAEPAVSMALLKTSSFPVNVVAPDLYRSADLQKEWGRLFQRKARIPQAGMALLNTKLSPHVVDRFMEEYAKAMQWCLDNPQQAGELVAQTIEMLTPQAVASSMAVSQLNAVNASESRAELEFFLQVLLDEAPALVGGKLPDNDFYYR
jgi:NitT/TauT family transport system substrate-binding protein